MGSGRGLPEVAWLLGGGWRRAYLETADGEGRSFLLS